MHRAVASERDQHSMISLSADCRVNRSRQDLVSGSVEFAYQGLVSIFSRRQDDHASHMHDDDNGSVIGHWFCSGRRDSGAAISRPKTCPLAAFAGGYPGCLCRSGRSWYQRLGGDSLGRTPSEIRSLLESEVNKPSPLISVLPSPCLSPSVRGSLQRVDEKVGASTERHGLSVSRRRVPALVGSCPSRGEIPDNTEIFSVGKKAFFPD